MKTIIITPVRRSRSRKYVYLRCIEYDTDTGIALSIGNALADKVYDTDVYARYDPGCDALVVIDDIAEVTVNEVTHVYDPGHDVVWVETE
jgi:hypothetical protein